MGDVIDTRMVAYTDIKTPEYTAINPLQKVPALILPDQTTVYESNVILDYLEDKYGDMGVRMTPPTPEGRQKMQLLCRIHDLYIASPNCTAPGFCHSQGAMYLSTGWHGAARGIDIATRAAKLAEIWRQLNWLEARAAESSSFTGGGEGGSSTPYLLGEQLTLADMTWFPTCTFMEFMLPRVFGWPHLFDPEATTPAPTPFPGLARWYTSLRQLTAFASTRDQILSYWHEMEAAGQFKPIQEEIAAAAATGLKFTYGVPQSVELNYQQVPPPGKTTGRYIEQPDKGDVVDEHVAKTVAMHDARELQPPATLDSKGFALQAWPTACVDFADEEQVVSVYYTEMIELVKSASGAERVFVFDHTVRETGRSNLNAVDGGGAAPVQRVHCDYTAEGAPRRLRQLGEQGIYSRLRERVLTAAELDQLAAGRYAFINVWRSIDDDHPVLQQPLAVCEESSIAASDRFVYELRFPDRTGENYSLRHSPAHRWYHYSRQSKDECLVFKVYDKQEDGPRFVFHTAFDDATTPPDAPPRRSVEARAIAFYDVPPLD